MQCVRYQMCVIFMALFSIVGGQAQNQQNQYIIHDAEALNALWTAVGGPTWPNQQGWPIPTGWQQGDPPSSVTGVQFIDTVYYTEKGAKRERWARGITLRTATTNGTFPEKLKFSRLESFHFYGDSAIPGVIPDFSECPRLVQFVMWGVHATKPLHPIRHPELEVFSLSRSKLTGNIPEFDCPKIRAISIRYSGIRGTFPNIRADSLRKLDITGYRDSNPLYVPQVFVGAFPEIHAPNLEELYVNQNAFTGQLPDIQRWPKLKIAHFAQNQFSGPIPTIQHDHIQELYVSQNPINAPLPSIVAPELTSFQAAQCGLRGTVPTWQLPKLERLQIDDNRLQGTAPLLTAPNLTGLYASRNRFTALPHLRASYPKLTCADVRFNSLHFDDIERNADIAGANCWQYWDQDSIDLFREERGGNIIFSVRVRGQANIHKWFHCGRYVDTAKGPSLVVKNKDYESCPVIQCVVTNPNAPDLYLVTRTSPPPRTVNPLIVAGLEFHGESTEWQASSTAPTYTTSGTIKINDFLRFSGSMEIDTEAVSVTGQGQFYLDDVPLPGGSVGTFQLCSGSFTLGLLGDKGAITGFASSAISRLPTIGGVKIHLSSISLVGGRKAHGISISGGITINGLSNGCRSNGPGPTVINIEGLTYSRIDGISVSGMQVQNMGFTSFPRFCLKNLEASYNDKEDKLSFGATVAMPFAEVSGGVKLLTGAVDSVAWRIEATQHAIPLGQTNIGIAGFFGDINKIVEGPLNVTLGGIFTSMVPKDFVKFDLAGTYESPSTIGASIDGVAIPLPTSDDIYQLKLKGALSYDFANGLAKISGEAHVGTTNGEEYVLDGALSVDMKASTLAMKGSLSGGYMIRAFEGEDADNFPYDWLNAKLGLPKRVKTDAQFVFIKSKLLFGTADLGPTLGTIDYVFDFSKHYRHPDFLYWRRSPSTKDLVGVDPDAPASQRSVVVPTSARRLVIRITGASTAPASTVTTPTNTTFSSATTPPEYVITSTGKKAFWTFLQPQSGNWTVDVPSFNNGDDIAFFIDQAPDPLNVSATQTQRSVTLRWNTTQNDAETDSLAFFVAGTGTNLDGYHLASAALATGTTTFALPDPFAACSFRIEAQGMRGFDLVSDTTDNDIIVPNGKLTPPSNVRARYFDTWKRLHIGWTTTPASDTSVRGYVVTAREPSGRERPIAETFRWTGWIDVAYEARPGEVLLVRSIDAMGNASCPVTVSDITTDVPNLRVADGAPVVVVPNPANELLRITFTAPAEGPRSIHVHDMHGRLVMATPPRPGAAGESVEQINVQSLATGVYSVSVVGNSYVLRSPFIIGR